MQDFSLTRLPLHFDVPSESLNAADYLVAVKSMEICLADFNRRLFDEKLDYEFLVLPAESGSFKGVTGVVVKTLSGIAIAGGVISLLETDLMKGIAEELTGKEVDYYQTGKHVGKFLSDLATGFFSMETDALEKLVPSTLNLDKSFYAKNKFYETCINNRSISGVGFTDEHNFPVKRDRFYNHLSKDKIRSVPSEFVLHEAIVVSPVDIDVNQVWRFKDTTRGKSVTAHMRDENFKRGFLGGKYPLKQSQKDDHVVMLVEYKKQERNGEVESKETCVHTIYHFNGQELVPLPENSAADVKVTDTRSLPMDQLW